MTTTLQVRIKTLSLWLSLLGIESVNILNNEFKETKQHLNIPKKFNRFQIRLTFIQVREEYKADLVTPYVSEKSYPRIEDIKTFCPKSFWINPKQILYTFCIMTVQL